MALDRANCTRTGLSRIDYQPTLFLFRSRHRRVGQKIATRPADRHRQSLLVRVHIHAAGLQSVYTMYRKFVAGVYLIAEQLLYRLSSLLGIGCEESGTSSDPGFYYCYYYYVNERCSRCTTAGRSMKYERYARRGPLDRTRFAVVPRRRNLPESDHRA